PGRAARLARRGAYMAARRPRRGGLFTAAASALQSPVDGRWRPRDHRMSIKSDRWIRRMSERPRGMIEPFEAGQVKQANGERIVSYGTSSYGYDVRCSREFKVFTNINSTIVDPKHFDPKSFVDIEADECII